MKDIFKEYHDSDEYKSAKLGAKLPTGVKLPSSKMEANTTGFATKEQMCRIDLMKAFGFWMLDQQKEDKSPRFKGGTVVTYLSTFKNWVTETFARFEDIDTEACTAAENLGGYHRNRDWWGQLVKNIEKKWFNSCNARGVPAYTKVGISYKT